MDLFENQILTLDDHCWLHSTVSWSNCIDGVKWISYTIL